LVEGVEWLRIEGMYRMSELPPMAEPAAYPLGHAAVDEMIRVRRGDFSVVTGIPNMGKSTWINEMACRLAHRHGGVTAFFSPEQRPQIDHCRALRWWFLGKPPTLWTRDEVAQADDWIDRHFVFLVPDDEADQDVTLDWVLDAAAASVIRQNAKMIVIDPWNEIEHAVPRDQTLTFYTGQAIKRFARRFNVHQLVAAHPAKVQKDKRTGEWPVPTLYDISDSAHWYNKPDIGMVVHWVPDRSIIRVGKVRYQGINGQRGDLPVEFDRYQGRYRVREDLLEPMPGAQAGTELALEGA
jgi:twinkle protein